MAAKALSSKTVYVAAIDKHQVPVRGLTAADFAVSEDGQARAITRAEPAKEPLHLAITGDWYVESGDVAPLNAFIAALLQKNPANQIALGSDLRWTSDRASLMGSVNSMKGMWLQIGNTMSLSLSELLDFARRLGNGAHSRPAVLTLFDERMEEIDGTNAGPSQVKVVSEPAILDALQAAHASFWAVVRAPDGALVSHSASNSLRRRVYLGETERTGGLWLDAGLDTRDTTKTLLAIAEVLDSQYALTYTSDDTSSGADLKVTTSRAGAKVLAPSTALK